LAYRRSLPLSNRYCMVVLKTCNEVMFSISVIPSEIRRFKFTVSWLCDDHIAAKKTFVVRGPRHFAMTATSPCCRRTTVFKDWRNIDYLPLIG
jgi:hypothetical protein